MTPAEEAAALRTAAAALEAQAEPQPTAAAATTAALEPAPAAAPLTHRFQAANLHALRQGSNASRDEVLATLIDAVAELQAQHEQDGHA